MASCKQLTVYLRRFLTLMGGVTLLLAAQLAWAAAGKIQLVVGTARISQQTGQERPAQRGDDLYEGDTVSTNANSNVQIRMIDDAIVWVRPGSQLKIERYRSDQHGAPKSEAALKLLSGTMREVTGTIGKASPADYKLSTPNATIGIRGTEFDATFATALIAAQLNTPPGTYNRVYVGSTVLEGPSGRVTLNKDEAGFMGMSPGDKPQLLPRIPEFMNAKPEVAQRGDVAPAGPRSLQISVRFGEGDESTVSSISSRDTNTEQRVRALEGERATLALAQGPAAGQAAQTGARPATQSMIDVVAKVSGNTALVQFMAQNQSLGSSGGQASKVMTSLSVNLGVWTDASGQGPWSGSSASTISSNSARSNNSKIYLKVDDLSR